MFNKARNNASNNARFLLNKHLCGKADGTTCHFTTFRLWNGIATFLNLKIKYLKIYEEAEIGTQVYLITWNWFLFSLFFYYLSRLVFSLCNASNTCDFKNMFLHQHHSGKHWTLFKLKKCIKIANVHIKHENILHSHLSVRRLPAFLLGEIQHSW